MKPKLLFPSNYRYLGYLLTIPGLVLGYLFLYHNYVIPGFSLHLDLGNFTNELALAMVIIGLVLIAFSRTKYEDELTARIRLNALYWAILLNYIFYTICLLLDVMYPGKDYFWTFSTYNLFVPLCIFIACFYYLLYRHKNEFVVKPVRFLPHKPFKFIGIWLSLILIILVFFF